MCELEGERAYVQCHQGSLAWILHYLLLKVLILQFLEILEVNSV
jgi:hypothetical protein